MLEFYQSQWLKPCRIQQKNRGRKSGDKDGKALYKLMNIDVYGEAMENLRNGIHAKLVNMKTIT